MSMKVQFFSRPNCHLCDEGLSILKLVQDDIHFEIEIINIEDDDDIHEKYMLMIPVVVKDGEIIQYGQLDYVTLYEAFLNK
jgi:predicted thioredoxin/glutaredoxin